MTLKKSKSIAFVVPLVGLALLMGWGERTSDDLCPGNLALEKSQQIVEGRPGVVDIFLSDLRWDKGCRFALEGYADIETVEGLDRKAFEIVMSFDQQARRWQQLSLDLQQ